MSQPKIPPELDEDLSPEDIRILTAMGLSVPNERKYRRGKKSALEILQKNTVREGAFIETILAKSIPFSEYQQLGLFHKHGYFENLGPYKEGMPMLPQVASPIFGKMVGEMAFSAYVRNARSNNVVPTFLSLGAGQGFLDYDLINHLTNPNFTLVGEQYLHHAHTMSGKSEFIVTDHGSNSLRLLEKQLAPLKSRADLSDRIKIQELNALDFSLDKKPFGIVYANELTDCIPNELVVRHEGEIYSVRVAAFDIGKPYVSGSISSGWVADIGSANDFLTPDVLRNRLDAADMKNIRFMPVFIPLSYDKQVSAAAKGLVSIENIDDDNYCGIYPLHSGLDGVFNSARNSFDHGAVILIDYFSSHNGIQNYNAGINHLRHYEFGQEDITVYSDPQQVIERATKKGMRLLNQSLLDQHLRRATHFLMGDHTAISRFRETRSANQIPPGAVIPDSELVRAMAQTYSFMIGSASGYTSTIFTF